MKKLTWRLLGFALLLIILLRFDWSHTRLYFKKVSLSILILAGSLELIRLLIESLRWKIILLAQKINYSLRDCYLSLLASIYLGVATPGRVGNFVRAFYLSSDKKLPAGFGFSGVIIDKLLELSCLIVLGIWGTKLLNSEIQITAIILASLLFLIFLLSLAKSKYLQRKILSPLLGRSNIRKSFEKGIDNFHKGIKEFPKHWLIMGFFLSLLAYFILFFHGFLLSHSLGLGITFLKLSQALALTRLINRVIPFSLFGWGVKDISLIILFNSWGFSEAAGITFSILFLFSSYLVSSLAGFVAWNLKPLLL